MRIAVAALAALLAAAAPVARTQVVPGAEVLLADSAHLVRGRRVGLITNHSARARDGTGTADLLHRASGVSLAALFGPEHGIRGEARGGAHITAGRDSATGVIVHSLYGAAMAPTPAMLRGLDVLLYDIQDVGARPYTYVWTMAMAMAAAGKAGIPFVVLDRPDPIRADIAEGGLIERRYRTITGLHPVPLRYGLTPGELARWLVGSGQVRARLTVVPMRGYRRSMWWEETGLDWVRPSPNIRTPTTALLYPGTVMLEATNLSEGRGTDRPLELAGAPWMTDAGAIARELNAMRLPGLRFDSATRTVGKGEEWGGRRIPVVTIAVTDRDRARPVTAVAHLLRIVRRRHPRDFRWRANGIEEVTGSRALRLAVERGGSARLGAVLRDWERERERWAREAKRYWLY